MHAFFFGRGLRRHGVGFHAARELLRIIPGVWGITFQDANAGAQPFWERAATDAVGDRWHLEKAMELKDRRQTSAPPRHMHNPVGLRMGGGLNNI